MANIFNTIKWQFKTTAIRNLIIKNEVRKTNLTRSVLISGLSVLVAAIILFYYHQKLVVTTTAARTQSDNITFKPVELNLHQTIESCVNILKIVAAHKDINIHNLTDRTVMIFADQDMIHTIFRNLLSNAIKCTPNFGFTGKG